MFKRQKQVWYGAISITSYTYNWGNMIFVLNKLIVHM